MMAVDQAVWHGTVDEKNQLFAAIQTWCQGTEDGEHCKYKDAEHKELVSPCAAHTMLVMGQRQLDGLLFFKARLESFRAKEWSSK